MYIMKFIDSVRVKDAQLALSQSSQTFASLARAAGQIRGRLVQPLLALAVGLLLTAATAEASHFRGASLTWKQLAAPVNTIELTIVEAWRTGADDTLSYAWGDGSAGFTSNGGSVIASNADFLVTRTVLTHTYAGAGPYTITGGSCCRIGGLVNSSGSSEQVLAVVDMRNGNSGSPTITSPIILQMIKGGLNTVPISYSDVDGDAVTFRMATSAESLINSAATAGGKPLSISASGVLSWDTSATTVGQLYAVQIVANDNHLGGATSVPFDFIIQIVDGSINHPPVASGNGGPFVVAVGQAFTNVITGTDQDGGNLTVTHQGLPVGGTLTPATGTTGPQPLAATFAWTPTAADSGNSVGVTIVFTDPTGLQASKSFTISVPANQPPTANAGPDQTVSGGADCQATVALNGAGSDPENGALTYAWSGPFGTVSAQNANVSLPVGQHTLTLTVTDNKGASATDTVVVTVKDVTPPTLSVPADIAVSNDPSKCGAIVSFAVTASDNCSGVSVVSSPASGSLFPLGSTVVTTTATDAAGLTTTKTFTVTVTDTERPVVVSNGDLIVNTALGTCAANVNLLGAVTATDNCPGVVVSFSPGSGTLFNKGDTIVTATATDAAGNTSSCTFKVTVRDVELPKIVTAAANKLVECDVLGNATALSSWLTSNGGALATDNCGPVTWTNNFTRLNAGCGATGSATVVFTATDGSGNSVSTTATFTIADTKAPVITTAAANKTVESDGLGNAAALSAWLASNGGAVATDSCGTVRWSHNFTALSDLCGATGAATVTFTATDECGNATTSAATFTIADTKAPVITTPAANKIVECDGAGNTAALSAWLASNGGAAATDPNGVTWTNNFTALTAACGKTGSATVTFTATDSCNNRSTTTATFTIVDTTGPVITSDVRDLFKNEAKEKTPVVFTLSSADACSRSTVTVTKVTVQEISNDKNEKPEIKTITSRSEEIKFSGNKVSIYKLEDKWLVTIYGSAIDECGNKSSAIFLVKSRGSANEGVGNGEDGNTPGDAHNGGNDSSGTSPGNPGASGKKS